MILYNFKMDNHNAEAQIINTITKSNKYYFNLCIYYEKKIGYSKLISFN